MLSLIVLVVEFGRNLELFSPAGIVNEILIGFDDIIVSSASGNV